MTRVRCVGTEGRLSPLASSPETPGAVPPRTQEADLAPQRPDLGKFLASFIYGNSNERNYLMETQAEKL